MYTSSSKEGALGRIASQFSLSRLYCWWVGEDLQADAKYNDGRGRSLSLNESISLDLPTVPVIPGSQLAVCFRTWLVCR